MKYQNPTQWKAYTRERIRFNTMLKYKKYHSLHTLILESKHDTKKLYKLTNNMISGKTLNSMPPNFVNHFLDKIEKIRSKLTTTRPYTPKVYDTPALQRFTTLTEDHLYKVIMDMPTKSCKVDIISTKLLK